MAALFQGRIVWCEVPDRHGRNPKVRPIIILNPNPHQHTAEHHRRKTAHPPVFSLTFAEIASL